MRDYQKFLKSKQLKQNISGFDIDRNQLHETLFDFQKDIVKWALKKGKAAIFAGTGLGKTVMQLEWARQVSIKTNGKILILAPLAVSSQTVREAQEKLNLSVTHVRQNNDVTDGLNIANYEILHKLDPIHFSGIVLDESSILKSFTGKVRTMIIDSFKNTPFKLACTATPAPNDFMELGNHSEFLNVMSRTEMLSMFFVHDGGETQKWRLKGHGASKFWEWVSSWAVLIQKPSDLGYEDGAFDLPPLNMEEVVIPAEVDEGSLIPVQAETLMERRQARRKTIKDRVKKCAEIVNATDKPFLVWCDLNDESKMLTELIPDAVEIKGSDKPEYKEKAMMDFSEGRIRVLVTKPSIAGMGLNWQHCADMAFVGLSDSFEQVFQAIRRCWRFGQEKSVNVHIIISELEGNVLSNIQRKEEDFQKMVEGMVAFTKNITSKNIKSTEMEKTLYETKEKIKLPSFLKEKSVV
ncbi:helicase [Pueribacillus theae]|uniref:Helicase n=1 Tax=Pueribacillus theae TaxID=2171751 RepID=A0A2U1JUK8_9BACI|nr:DEAD/DEAH box helicase [Pueribacillus theae]PWA08639.1 helicase [Pueribacillus theae]